jgi:hypothetical protein
MLRKKLASAQSAFEGAEESGFEGFVSVFESDFAGVEVVAEGWSLPPLDFFE